MKKLCFVLTFALMSIFGISVNVEAGYTPGIDSYTNSMIEGAKTVFYL